MTYVIAEPCIDVLDRACVEECPVDCIHEGARALYIHPDEYVDCGACEPVCPVEAIFYEDDVPNQWAAFTDDNARFFADPLTRARAVGRIPRRRDQDRSARCGHRTGRRPPTAEHMTDQPGHLDDAPIDPATSKPRRRLLKLLRRSDTPLDVYQLADTTGLHITTVRFHLDVLARAGQVTVQKTPRTTPGRPRTVYTVRTEEAPPDGYRPLASHCSPLTSAPPPAPADDAPKRPAGTGQPPSSPPPMRSPLRTRRRTGSSTCSPR